LAGDDIPVGAQIVGICDVYQALISPRAQRPALDRTGARRLIEQEIGRLWNPAIAQAFLGMLAERDSASSGGRKSAPDTPRFRVAEG
jgi:response regulator RpfG family c-di-GMP phosphodiesterase